MDNESNEVPFRISETVSYGPGVLYRMKLHENNTLALNGFVSGVADIVSASTACLLCSVGSAFIWDLRITIFSRGRGMSIRTMKI